MDVSHLPIQDSYKKSDRHFSVVERYYTPRYCLNVLESGNDYCVLLHSNKVCVITLAPSHNLLKKETLISEITYPISDEVMNKLSGKRKRGAHRIIPSSSILTVHCPGKTYTLSGCIAGKLLEVNKHLVDDPNCLLSDPQGKGFLAIVMSDLTVFDHIKKSFITAEQYSEIKMS